MNRIHRLAALTVFVGLAAPSIAAVCDNVTFSLNNVSDGPIKIYQVGYRDLDSSRPGNRITENVTDFVCPASHNCVSTPQDLGGVTKPRQNHELTDIQFLHAHQDIFGAWMAAVWSTKNVPTTMTCTDGRNYGAYDVN